MPRRSLFQSQKIGEPTIATATKEEITQAVIKETGKEILKKTEKEDDLFIDDTDDWSTVPAFLRRNKK
jgi:hypothetical protein